MPKPYSLAIKVGSLNRRMSGGARLISKVFASADSEAGRLTVSAVCPAVLAAVFPVSERAAALAGETGVAGLELSAPAAGAAGTGAAMAGAEAVGVAVLAESLAALAALAESTAAVFALALDLRLAFWALAESAAAAESLTSLALAGKGWDIPGTWE